MTDQLARDQRSREECTCEDEIAKAYESMEINAGSMATAGDWLRAKADGRSRCPVHGAALAPADEGRGDG